MAHLRLKEIATKQRYNKTQLGKAAGVNRNTTAKYWDNTSPMVSLEILDRYARVLGVKVTDMIVNEDEPQAENKQ